MLIYARSGASPQYRFDGVSSEYHNILMFSQILLRFLLEVVLIVIWNSNIRHYEAASCLKQYPQGVFFFLLGHIFS